MGKKIVSPAIKVSSAPSIKGGKASGHPIADKGVVDSANQQPLPGSVGRASGKFASPANGVGPDMGKSSHGGSSKMAD